MSDLLTQITEIEKEIRETPYHKGTEHHIGKLRARLAKLKDKSLESTGRHGGGGGGYAVKKQGDATVVLIGPPSAGKSTLINKITNAESKVAPYEFTTVSVIPGMLNYKDAYIQILDVPGLIEGAKEGKGRGREVLSVARGADLLLIMTDIERLDYLERLLFELESAGIRINITPPKIKIKKDLQGGLTIHSNIKQNLLEQTILGVAHEFGIRNGEITINEKLSMDSLIDSFSPNRVYLPAIFVINKSDIANFNSVNLKVRNDSILISAKDGTGIEYLFEEIWKKLNLIRIYLVRPGEDPSFHHSMIIKAEETLKDLAEKLGSDFSLDKKSAKIWGSEAKYPGQEVSLSTLVKEGMQVRFI